MKANWLCIQAKRVKIGGARSIDSRKSHSEKRHSEFIGYAQVYVYLVGGLAHDFFDFAFSWKNNNPN
jgi:hypothetical protein